MIQTKRSRPFYTAFALFALAIPAYTQTTNASLSGTVIDPAGRVVPAADVTATNTDTGTKAKTRTNQSGIYTLPGLKSGHYSVAVNKQGFKQIELTDLTLQVTDTATEDFRLEIGAASETVTVEASALNINTTDASVSTVIDREFVDELPLNGRSLQNLLLLAPGVVQTTPGSAQFGNAFSVNGNRDTSSANWTVDGISANLSPGNYTVSPDALTPGRTVLGTTQSLISIDALQEFRVVTSSYGAEYGVAPGAQVQFESRSGTNRLHGSGYDYLRNRFFDANDWFANSKGLPLPDEHQNDFGGTLGGPIVIPHLINGRNKLFFFFSYEGLRLLQPQILTAESSPTAAYRAAAPAGIQPILDALPLPNGKLYGNGWGQWNNGFSAPSNVDSWSLRSDYSLSTKAKLFARFSYAPSSETDYGDGSLAKDSESMLMSTVGVTLTPAGSIVDDFRINFSRSTDIGNVGPLPSINGSDPSKALAALAAPVGYTQGFAQEVAFGDKSFADFPEVERETDGSWLHQWDVVNGLKWQKGRHQFRFGMEYNRHTSARTTASYDGYYEFDAISSVSAAIPDYIEIDAQPTVLNSVVARFSAYAGDNWKLSRRLTLDYGVRYELPFAPRYQDGFTPLLVTSIADIFHPTVAEKNQQYNTSYRNFAPRLGIAYLLKDTNHYRSVLRTGGGLFYNTESSSNFDSTGYPYAASTVLDYGVPYPAPPALIAPPVVSGSYTTASLASQVIDGIDPHLAVPRIWQWNFTIEQELGDKQSLTVAYVGSAGRRLYTTAIYFPQGIRDTPFSTNGTASNYDGLQVKYDRHISHGLRALVSYTWAHSIDNTSQNNFTYAPVWGNSDFDIRHNISVAMVYTLPSFHSDRVLKQLTSGWDLSNNFNAHTGTPASLQGAFFTSKVGQNNPFVYPNQVPGQPVYVYGPQYPGGEALNPLAFVAPPKGQTGNVGRNVYRNLGFEQLDTSLQRKFVLGEKRGLLRLRLDAFNIMNHPNFASFAGGFPAPTNLSFGLATRMVNQASHNIISPLYSSGGPRSLQISLRYEF